MQRRSNKLAKTKRWPISKPHNSFPTRRKIKMTTLQKVKAITDESGHWYVIPNDLEDEFFKDEQDEDMVDSGEFDEKYGKYMTGGALNLVQLYAEL
jgi:hypothetical protein